MLAAGDPIPPVTADLSLTTFDGEALGGDLAVRRFTLTECIDEPFELVVDVMSEDQALDVQELLGARGTMPVVRSGHAVRIVHGVVTRAEYVATRSKQLFARLTLESPLAMLRYSRRRRIFSDQTLLEVLEAVAAPVFERFGGAWYFDRLHGEFEPRDYVVQYEETDLEFVLRLLSEAGLCLLSADGGEHETLVLVDASAALPGLGVSPMSPEDSEPVMVALVPGQEEEASAESVQYLGQAYKMRTSDVSVVARDWKTPAATTFGTSTTFGSEDDCRPGRWGHLWEYHPGRIDEGKGSEGDHADSTEGRAWRHIDEHQADGQHVSGRSNLSALAVGSTFELTGHPYAEFDASYAVLRVEHEADFPEVEVGTPKDTKATYANIFVAQVLEDHKDVRPPLRPRPSVLGPQTATVVGPPGEEVHTDALGRVRVRFHWDGDDGRTCWLRVMQSWAGSGFGASFIPRVGMEVVVSFLDGDPDRPLVTGCVYTGSHRPPGNLPETMTCTTLRTQSTPGGEGFNELRFEDAAGHEEVFLHAQRNHRETVRANQNTSVGASRSVSVGKHSKRSIGGNETVQVGTPNAEEPGHLEVHVTGGEMRTVGDVHSLDMKSGHWTADEAIVAQADKTVWVSCAPGGSALDRRPTGGSLVELLPKSVTIEAPETITLKVGNTSLQLTPRGIFLEGAVITASVEEQLWLTSDAGRLALTQEHAGLYGGKKSESTIELSDDGHQHKAKETVYTEAKFVTSNASDVASIKGGEAKLVATKKATVHSEGAMDLTAPSGAVFLQGSTVDIN